MSCKLQNFSHISSLSGITKTTPVSNTKKCCETTKFIWISHLNQKFCDLGNVLQKTFSSPARIDSTRKLRQVILMVFIPSKTNYTVTTRLSFFPLKTEIYQNTQIFRE